MQIIHTNDINHNPLNIDKLIYIFPRGYGTDSVIKFCLRDNHSTEWTFDNQVERDLYLERILSLINSKNISLMTKL